MPPCYTKLAWSSILACFHVVIAEAQLIINEIHPTPAAGEPEWIECINTTNRTVNVSGWYVCDNRSCGALPSETYIPAKSYVVFTRDSAALREARPLPLDAIVVEAKLPSLNNTIDDVVLRNSDSTIVDSLSYTMAWGRKGLTLERTIVDGVSVWSASLSSDSASCGYRNSVVRLEHDLRIAEVRAGRGTLDVVFVNHGRATSAARLCAMQLDGVAHDNLTTSIPALFVDELYVWSVAVEELRVLHPALNVDVEVALTGADDRAENDVLRRTLVLPPNVNTVTITEIMFDPFDTQADYVEIYNGSKDTLDIDGWYILDGEARTDVDVTGDDTRARAIIEASLTVEPGEYAVVLMDTMHASMIYATDKSRAYICKKGINANANGDALALCTSSGFLVDSVLYTSDMHIATLAATKGIALEKRDPKLSGLAPSSWTSSGNLKGGTPARVNSVQIEVPITSTIEAAPNPFSSQPGDAKYPCVLAFTHPFVHAIVGLRICTPEGYHVRWLLNATFAGSEGVVIWDGTDDMGRRVPRGQYVAALEAADASSTSMHRDAYVVVVGN